MPNKDSSLMGTCIQKETIDLFKDFPQGHPLDAEVVEKIRK